MPGHNINAEAEALVWTADEIMDMVRELPLDPVAQVHRTRGLVQQAAAFDGMLRCLHRTGIDYACARCA